MTRRVLLCWLFVMSIAVFARAEKAPLSAEELRETATHIVTGKVVAVYQRTEKSGDWEVTGCVAEIRVAKCEKGDSIKENDLVYARYWHRRWIGKGQIPPSTIGHRGRPVEGDTMRVYMARNAYDGFGSTKDGGFNVIGANGFEKLAAKEKSPPESAK